MFPSSSFAREYEPYSVLTTDGQAYSGVISRQTPHAIHLRGADRIEVRIERDDIDQLQPSDVSIMPQGLDKILSPAELSDVLSFLQSLTAQADGIQ